MRHVLDTDLNFFEGEPEPEPLEEHAIHDVDEELMLEWELEDEDVSEDELDDDLLEAMLEELEELEGQAEPASA